MKTYYQEKLEKLGRRYYEVFGDLEAEVHFLKLTVLVLLFFLFASAAAFVGLTKKPPVVIRVSEVREAQAIPDLKTNNESTEPEIIYFAKSFMKRFTEYNSYTLARDFSEAMNQMTVRYQKLAKRELVESGLLTKIKDAELNASLEFKEEKIEKNTQDYALVSLVAVRNLTSYKNPSYRESALLKAEIVLKKRPRTIEIPSGLLVENYREIILNKLEDIK